MKKNILTLNLPWMGAIVFNLLLLSTFLLSTFLSTNVNAHVNEGENAPDFTLKSNTGENIRLSEYRGNVILINFWASWCSPC